MPETGRIDITRFVLLALVVSLFMTPPTGHAAGGRKMRHGPVTIPVMQRMVATAAMDQVVWASFASWWRLKRTDPRPR